MNRALYIFRLSLVLATAAFMAYHTSIFIGRIEPSPLFAWLASLLVEGMIISLAVTRTWTSQVLLVPLFLISVLSASMSFVVSNERLLDEFFRQSSIEEQLRADLSDTQQELSLASQYTTKTLTRERQIKDQLAGVLRGKTGQLPLVNAGVFLVLVFVLQGVSVYTAASLKCEISAGRFTETPTRSSEIFQSDTSEMSKMTRQDFEIPSDKKFETDSLGTPYAMTDFTEVTLAQAVDPHEDSTATPPTVEAELEQKVVVLSPGLDRMVVAEAVQKMKATGKSYDALAAELEVSRSAIVRVCNWPSSSVSDQIFEKVGAKIAEKYLG